MEKGNTSPQPENRIRRSLRVLRPLFWWLILVLVLYGIRTHQRLMEQTRLNFSVSLEGRMPYPDATATLDGKPAFGGERISLGRHIFAVTHPKGETFSSNLFIWYGGHDFGRIDLKRAKGTLVIQSSPPAAVLSVSGPEFTVTLTNSSGINSSVPTDTYVVEARYPHSRESAQVSVFSGTVATWRFAPRLGSLGLTCNQPDVLFQLQTLDGQSVESGKLPATIPDLPAGSYKLLAWHGAIRREERVAISTGRTNDMDVRFVFGSALIQTEPPGAEVTGSDGHYWGITPLLVAQLQPGSWNFVLQHNGYEPAAVSLEITGEATNTFTTNLVSVNYTRAVGAARQYFAESDYVRSLESANAALDAKPGDPDAILLQKQASTGAGLQRAEAFGKQGDFATGIRELKSVLQATPENDEATHMLADFERQQEQQAKRQQELAEKQRQERAARPKQVYESCAAKLSDGELFDTYMLTTSKALDDAREGIMRTLRDLQPGFKVFPSEPPAPETFKIVAEQGFAGGFRSCLIVGGRASDSEVQVFFKVREYTIHHGVSVAGLLNVTVSEEHIPVHPSRIPQMTDELKAQVKEGVRIVSERIQQAMKE